MIHEVLPDRLMMYVNQAHNIYIYNVPKIRTWCYFALSQCHSLVLHKCYWKKLRIQYLGFLG